MAVRVFVCKLCANLYSTSLMLTDLERKSRLPHGAIRRAAEKTGKSESVVSRVASGEAQNPKIQRALFRMMVEPDRVTRTADVMTLGDVFGPPKPTLRRPARTARKVRTEVAS